MLILKGKSGWNKFHFAKKSNAKTPLALSSLVARRRIPLSFASDGVGEILASILSLYSYPPVRQLLGTSSLSRLPPSCWKTGPLSVAGLGAAESERRRI